MALLNTVLLLLIVCVQRIIAKRRAALKKKPQLSNTLLATVVHDLVTECLPLKTSSAKPQEQDGQVALGLGCLVSWRSAKARAVANKTQPSYFVRVPSPAWHFDLRRHCCSQTGRPINKGRASARANPGAVDCVAQWHSQGHSFQRAFRNHLNWSVSFHEPPDMVPLAVWVVFG